MENGKMMKMKRQNYRFTKGKNAAKFNWLKKFYGLLFYESLSTNVPENHILIAITT